MRKSFRFGLLFLISLVAFAALAALVMLLAPAAASAGAAPAVPETVTAHEVLVPGLASPRGLIFHNGSLYAALAGSGGPASGICVPSPEGGPDACLGETGKVIRVDFDANMDVISVTDVVTGLPSLAVPTAPITGNAGGTGAHDIAFDESGNMYLSLGLGAAAVSRTLAFSGTSGELLGHLVEAEPGGGITPLVDISAYEDTNNPAGGPIDSNPWYMVYEGGHFYLTDAGGNDLLDIVTGTSTISTVATFPLTMTTFFTQMISMEAVPTGVDIGPNGNFYVGQLTGFPFPPGGANVFEVDAGGTISTAYSGFTTITDIVFDEEGNLYVLEMASNGLLAGPPIGTVVRIAPDGTRTVLADDLLAPTGMTVGPDGALYISNFGVSSAIGEIVRVETEFDLLLPIIKRAP